MQPISSLSLKERDDVNPLHFLPQENSIPVREADVQKTGSLIGKKILPLKDGQLTPQDKHKILLITGIALSAIAIACVALAAIFTPLPLLALLIVPLLVGGAVATYYLCTQKPDFQKRAVREKAMNNIANSSLTTIAATYEKEDILGFQLLDRIALEEKDEVSLKKRATLYHQFLVLYDRSKRAEDNYKNAREIFDREQEESFAYYKRDEKGHIDWTAIDDGLMSFTHKLRQESEEKFNKSQINYHDELLQIELLFKEIR
jgi:hypothetical protein